MSSTNSLASIHSHSPDLDAVVWGFVIFGLVVLGLIGFALIRPFFVGRGR